MLKGNKRQPYKGMDIRMKQEMTLLLKMPITKTQKALKFEYEILAAIQKRDVWGEVYKRYKHICGFGDTEVFLRMGTGRYFLKS